MCFIEAAEVQGGMERGNNGEVVCFFRLSEEILCSDGGEALAQVPREAVAALCVEVSKARLARGWSNLGQWK